MYHVSPFCIDLHVQINKPFFGCNSSLIIELADGIVPRVSCSSRSV